MPRTCQWPTGTDNDPQSCGTRLPSFTGTRTDDGVEVVIDVCDVHAPDAENVGYTVTSHRLPRRRPQAAALDVVDEAVATVQPEIHGGDPGPRDELTVMASIVDALDPFGSDAQRRIVAWAADFYGVPL